MSIDDADAALQIVEAGRQRVIARLRDSFARQVGATADLGDVDPTALDSLITQAADRAGASLWRISLAEGAVQEYGISLGEALSHHAVASAAELVGAPDEPQPVPSWVTLPAATVEAPRLPEPARYDAAPNDAWDEDDEIESESEPEEAQPELVRPRQAPQPTPEADVAQLDGTPPELVTRPEVVSQPEPEPVATASSPQAIRIAAIHSGGIETLKTGDKDLELRFSDAGLDVIRRSSGAAIGRLDWTEVTAVELEQNRKGLRGKKSRTMQVRTSRGQAAFELPGLTDEEATEHLEPMLKRLRDSGILGG